MTLTPVPTSYPGVYVAEMASGVRTITGVATSVTAFVGRCARGPVDTPVLVTGMGDFDRIFGGLWRESHLGYSVRDYFRLGGGLAIVVRVHKQAAATDWAALELGSSGNKLKLRAASPGLWGKALTAAADKNVKNPSDTKQFNLAVTDGVTKEAWLNVSLDTADARYVGRVLADSVLVRLDGTPPASLSVTGSDGTADATGGGDGAPITATEVTGTEATRTGLYALEGADLVNLLVVPPYAGTGEIGLRDVDTAVVTAAQAYAKKRRAVLLLDPPPSWTAPVATSAIDALSRETNTAVYFPRITQPDPLRDYAVCPFAPSGAVAGLIAATDASRGVWKSPAGMDVALTGIAGLTVALNDQQIGQLNQEGVNCLRQAPGAGHVVWGARTSRGADRLASEWKYLAVRRTAYFLEESLFRGLQWAVFEPNDVALWAQIRLNVGAFMNNLFRQGAFQGATPKEAYYVKCDKETTTQTDINLGVVNIQVGFAPLKPAEFVVLRLQQMAGQIGV